MKPLLIFYTIINLGTCAVTLLMLGGRSDQYLPPTFDKGVARIVMQERLNQLSDLASSPVVRLSKSCIDRTGQAGLVVGSGDTASQSRVIDGIPVTDSARFSYTASISAHCQAYNPNCYDLEKLELEASRKIEPRL